MCFCLSVFVSVSGCVCVCVCLCMCLCLSVCLFISVVGLVVRFHSLTGRLLLEVRRMQATAPESFYACLRTDLLLDFVTMMKFTRALSSLDEFAE